jgi:hypothetical protein
MPAKRPARCIELAIRYLEEDGRRNVGKVQWNADMMDIK